MQSSSCVRPRSYSLGFRVVFVFVAGVDCGCAARMVVSFIVKYLRIDFRRKDEIYHLL